MNNPILSVKHLNKWYGGIHALCDLSLDMRQGEVIGLIGDNGAGKSTFIKILSGVHRQTSGQIFFDEKAVSFTNSRDAMKFGIETIYQNTAMIPEMSISGNVFIGREKRKWGPRGFGVLDKATMAKKAKQAIEDVGLHLPAMETPVKELSGGQKQGVAIARAMLFRSRIFILDEPTNHLSVKETNKVLDYVHQLKTQNISVIFISHNLHHVHQVSDRVVAFAKGQKIADVPGSETTVGDMIRLID